MRGLAAILVECNAPLVIDEIEIPKLAFGQVLVNFKSSGICGAQIGEITGAKGDDRFLPHLLGHEGGGIVVDIGPGVKNIHIDDRVVAHWRKGNGIDADPPRYAWRHGSVGGGWITTFNEYAVISENRLTSVDSNIPFEIAALFGCAVTTAFGLVNNEAQLKIGQSIAVIGCGGVGLNVIQAASMVSGYPIMAVDMLLPKLNLAKLAGATHLINSSQDDLMVEAQKILPGGYNVVVDCTGIPSVINQCLQITAPQGKLILVGQPRIHEGVCFQNMRQHYIGKTILDSQGGLTNPSIDIPKYSRLFLNGKLNFLHDLITHHYDLSDINSAIDTMRTGLTGRCIIDL